MKQRSARTALVVVALSLAGCQVGPGSDRAAPASCGGEVAIFGAFTGANAGTVLPSLNGARLAVERHNAAHGRCPVTLREFDTQGSPEQASPIAAEISRNSSFTSVIGGHFAGESKATMQTFEAAGLVMVSPSATAEELTATGNTSFHRVVGDDATQAAAAARYTRDVLRASRVLTIDDGSTYGAGIMEDYAAGLGSAAVASDRVQADQTNFDAIVSRAKAAKADVIAYAGYANEAGPLLKQVRAAGVTAGFVGFGVYDPGFLSGAGAAAEGALVFCQCLPADRIGGTFTEDYVKKFGQEPGSYGAEGYDAAQVLLDGYAQGNRTRAEMAAWVNRYDASGVTKRIRFEPNGDLADATNWTYEVLGGRFVAGRAVGTDGP